jgi:hypothetical protein
MFCRGTRRKRVEMRAGQAEHRTEAASLRIAGKDRILRIPLSATKIQLDPILGWAKNEFGANLSLV